MASDFANKFTAAAMPKLLNRLGETITYTPPGGSTVSRSAVVNITSDGPGPHWTATFDISSDATLGVASPVKGALIVYDGNTWTVTEAIPNYAGGHELHAVMPRLTQ